MASRKTFLRSSTAGFTLLEVLIALAIAGLIVLGIARVTSNDGLGLQVRVEAFWESELAHSVLFAYYIDPHSVEKIEELSKGYVILLSDTSRQYPMAPDMSEEMEYRSIEVSVSSLSGSGGPRVLSVVIARRK